MYQESNIKYESDHFFVLQQGKSYQLLKKESIYSTLIGEGTILEDVIRCAKRLEPYHHKVGV